MEKVGWCVWTDEEVGVLLRVTLKYKLSKLREEDADWEACKQKYSDIWEKFHEALRQKEPSPDFPRTNGETTKAQLTAKLKNIRGKFRKAVDSGRRTGYGKTVLIYYELCDRIWGGGDAELINNFTRTPALDAGVESADFNGRDVKEEESRSPSPPSPLPPCPERAPASPCSERAPVSPCSDRAPASPSTFPRTRRRRLRLQKAPPPVNGHVPLKRKAPADLAQEDLEIKRGMLELLRSQSRRADERMERLVGSVEALVSVITQSHAQLLAQARCTCGVRPPQAAESYSSTDSQSEPAALKLTVKKEPENSELQ